MLSILQPEITTLESQVAALQAQIAAHTERITLLNETELLAGGSLEALKGAIQRVSSLAPDAIASLKSAVLSLFQGDSPNNDIDGNQPINPAPQRSDNGKEEVEIAVNPEALAGQSTDFASPLCCQLEDCDTRAALTGQSVDLACVISDAPQQEPYVELILVTHLVAYQRREDGEIICCYLGGNNKSRLKDWGSWLCNQHSVGSGFELRVALRMTAFKHELKIWGMSRDQIQRLAETDTRMTPPSRYHVASFPVAANLLQTDEDSTPQFVEAVAESSEVKLITQVFQVGDKVEVTSDRHGVELVGQSGIVTAGTATGAAVNVNGTQRLFCSDEVTLTSSSPTPRNADDDLFPTAPAPAYNATPIGRAGAMANWKARTLGGIGVNLKDCGTGGIKTIEEWQRIEADQKAQKALAASTSDTATDDDNE